MKVASFVLLIAVIVQQSNAVPEDLTKFLNECKEAEKVTDADVMNFKNRIKPATKEVKCLTTCIIEKIGLISNNQLSKDGVLKFIKSLSVPMPSFEKVLQDVSQAVDGCKTIQDPDRCEFGVKVVDCMIDANLKIQLLNLPAELKTY